jgi:hypothetical protein
MLQSLEDRAAMRRARTATCCDDTLAEKLRHQGIEPEAARSGPGYYGDIIIWTGALIPRGSAIYLSLEMGDANALDDALTYKWNWPCEADSPEVLRMALDELQEPEVDVHSD